MINISLNTNLFARNNISSLFVTASSVTHFNACFSNLRYDSIAQLLTLANVRAHTNVMLCESVGGLLLGAVTERLGGKVVEHVRANTYTVHSYHVPLNLLVMFERERR